MAPIRTPKTLRAATALLERFADVAGRLAQVEAIRAERIAGANADADRDGTDFLAELAAIRERLEAWWGEAAAELTQGNRKSIELGGCLIGTRTSRESLTVKSLESDVVEALKPLRWAKALFRIKTTLDRAAALKALKGPRRADLEALGLRKAPREERFFLERAEQTGTLAEADS